MRSCLFCDRDIRPRQEALQCDGCHRWQHRVCSTGISRAMYRATLRGEEGGILSWYCTECGTPDVPVLHDVARIQTSVHDETTLPYMELSAVPTGHRDETTLPYMDEPPVLELSAVPTGHRDETTLPYMDEPPTLERSDVPFPPQPLLERSDRPIHSEGISDEPPVLEISVVSPIRSAVDASVVHGRLEETQSIRPSVLNATYTVPDDAREDLDPLEVSFELTDQDHDDPDPIVEQSLGDAIITDTIVEEEPTTYEIVEEGTIRRAKKLVSSDGYAYTIKCASRKTTTWRCSVRNRRVWCRATVSQLWSVHAFIQKDGATKQVPLCFVLMSRRRTEDYEAVLQQLLRSMSRRPAVEGFVMDFETACWKAVRSVFPRVDLKGCSFHWAQAILRKVDSLGLRATYRKRQGVHDYIRKFLALPFLPSSQISPAFVRLREAADTPILRQFVEYVDRTWFQNSVWSPSNWCVYRQSVRTNNDVEGWHRRINTKARRTNLPFYLLVPLLHKEGVLVDLQMRLVAETLLARHQTTTYRRIQGKIHTLWGQLDEREITTAAFLRSVGKIYCPAAERVTPDE